MKLDSIKVILTFEQVIAAYPEKDPDIYPREKYGYDFILYVHAFFDEDGNLYEGNNGGPVYYSFDENGVLTHVEVRLSPKLYHPGC